MKNIFAPVLALLIAALLSACAKSAAPAEISPSTAFI